MSYVTTRDMLLAAQRGGYAVGAFNFENMEMAQAIIAAAEQLRAPVILQTTPSTVKYASPVLFAAIVKTLAGKATVPVALHLDHGSSPELCENAAASGYSSVMFDGSGEEFEKNIELTAKAVTIANKFGIPTEAELGKVGGKEDDHEANADNGTNPDDAVRFVKETGISSLAVAIGTAHGFYVGTPVLDVERLIAIRKKLEANGCSVPLVLHGASGLSPEAVRSCIEEGICKVNFATELRVAYTAAVRETLASDEKIYDPKKYGNAARNAVIDAVKQRILVCGANEKAN
ncbi:MAG: ketose-bisphosphate aldolase [Eubacteriales bacterium]